MMGMVRGLSVALARPSAGPASSVVRRLAPNGWHRTETATSVFAGNVTIVIGMAPQTSYPAYPEPPGTAGRAQPANQPSQVESGCHTQRIHRGLFARDATRPLEGKLEKEQHNKNKINNDHGHGLLLSFYLLDLFHLR